MSNVIKNINIKKTHFDNINNINDFDPYDIKIDKKPYKNILIYFFTYVTIKGSKYVKINIVNPLYLVFKTINGYFEEIIGKKYFTIVSTNESTDKIKKYEESWNKIRDLIRSVTKKLDDYNEQFIKTKLNSDNKLSLN